MKILGRRSAGVLVPLFSIRTGREWGVGEYPDLARFAKWAGDAGFSLVMTLPLLEPSPGNDSPYSSCSFFALDPLYLRIADVPELEALGGMSALTSEERALLDAVSESPRVRHADVRRLKDGVLRRCFERFERDVDASSERRAALARFVDEHGHWIHDYALFRTLKERFPQSWRDWPLEVRDASPERRAELRREHAREIAYRTWLQHLAFGQHQAARREAAAAGVALGGDEPFLVADDSADVWARKDRYRFDATVGAPPDAFSADGQEWGLPPYRWERIAEEGYELFAQRGRHTAQLYDLIRIDHVVGLYRTYHRPIDKSAHYFWPQHEPQQRAQGEAVLRAFASSGTELIAEDLGVIPDFVRASLKELGIPGYRVLRWEKDHDRFRDPAAWPELSVATTGTHDTESSIEWWDALPEWERNQARRIPQLADVPAERARKYGEEVHAALLDAVYRSPSRLALLPVQDVLALRDRVNTPNTVGPENWSWRMPWTISVMEEDAIVRGRRRQLRRLAELTERIAR
ncbi:4-alpha-glucanotransferase [Sandaracinus amylolyticus]|uniref:4-alpha-glucanotransferase n=1 Tax=Sandaracinus amylolyticus TaxID=927083 RepID=UPI001F01A0E9|nr:4-alpha-glucanotransferase [Sandaracinus amylolyticus]UJR78805.1 4-alpha-glucanotransferase [Sandaracinus amylolyticus]